MQRLAPSVLVIVVLVAFAGCNAFSGGSDTSTDTPLVTPMDVPTDEPTPTFAPTATPTDTPAPTFPSAEPRLPSGCTPGLSELGFANASALAAVHNRTLQNTSFTVSTVYTSLRRNGSVFYYREQTFRVGENHTRVYRTSEQLDQYGYERSAAIWIGEQVVIRRISGHTTHYGARPMSPSGRRVRVQTFASIPEAVFDNVTACAIDRFTTDETTLFVVAFTDTEPSPRLYPNATVVQSVDGRALVSSSGIVYEIRLDYTVRTEFGAVVYVTKSTSYTDIGSTTVERPVWYGKVVNQTQTNQTSAEA